MDLRLVICVAVLALVSVEAMRIPEMGRRCRIGCPVGFEPDFACRCRRGSFQDMSPCNLRRCPWNTQCEVQGGRAVCVPEGIAFPTEPLLPKEHLPIDPIVSRQACMLPKQAGHCLAYMPRYYYNSANRRCERFIYGGCGGNENNFRSLRECSSRCDRKPRRSYY